MIIRIAPPLTLAFAALRVCWWTWCFTIVVTYATDLPLTYNRALLLVWTAILISGVWEGIDAIRARYRSDT